MPPPPRVDVLRPVSVAHASTATITRMTIGFFTSVYVSRSGMAAASDRLIAEYAATA